VLAKIRNIPDSGYAQAALFRMARLIIEYGFDRGFDRKGRPVCLKTHGLQ
jgi:hypothetical protein